MTKELFLDNETHTTERSLSSDKDLLSQCIHCGLCLPACPTYLATGRETESPRGRIYLLTLWAAGKQDMSVEMAEHIESCLGCLGCQTACPSGVDYRQILDNVRPYLAKQRPMHVRSFMRFCFRHLLPNYKLLRLLGKLVRYWQQIGGGQFLRKTTLYLSNSNKLSILSGFLNKLFVLNSFLPPVPACIPFKNQFLSLNDKRDPVQLFSGCVMDVFYSHVNRACVRLLQAQEHLVETPPQTCCGALASHHGDTDIAKELAKRNIEYFEQTKGPIVVTSSGCSAMLKEYGKLLGSENSWRLRARQFSNRVVDSTEFLANQEFKLKRKVKTTHKIAYHSACHLAHGQNMGYAPQKLLERIAGVGEKELAFTLVPLKEQEHCCGSAGIYNLTHTKLSLEVLARKIDYIQQTGADLVITTNPGCLLQLERGIKERGLNIEVVHILQLLDYIYGSGASFSRVC